MSVSGTYCPPNCPKYPLFRTMYASTMLQLLELFRGRLNSQQGGRPASCRGIDLPRVDDDILHEDGETRASRARYEVDAPAEDLGLREDGEPEWFRRDYAVQDGIELRHISRAPHARRCELDFRNHIRGPSRRAQGAQEGWTPERFASHVAGAFTETGLRVHH